MVDLIPKGVAEFFDDFSYNGRKTVELGLGKIGIKGGALVSGGALASMVAGGTAGDTIAMLIAIPLSVGFSAAMVQGDHLHRCWRIKSQFAPEIASWLAQNGTQKTPAQVTDDDAELAARGDRKNGIPGNPALAAALDKSAHERSWGIAISAVATTLATVLAFSLKPIFPHFGLAEGLATTGLDAAIGGVIGLGVYMATKPAMHWAAEKLFDLEKTTVVDRVRGMRRELEHGKNISQAEVLGVFLEAHPELSRAVRREYGRNFARLDAEKRDEVLAAFGPQMRLNELTDDINSRRVRPEELAFASFGQASGVARKLGPDETGTRLNVLERAWHKCVSTMHRWTHHRAEDGNAPHKLEVEAAATLASHGGAVSHEEEHEAAQTVSFVHRLGKSPASPMLFAERVSSRSGSYAELAEQPAPGSAPQL